MNGISHLSISHLKAVIRLRVQEHNHSVNNDFVILKCHIEPSCVTVEHWNMQN